MNFAREALSIFFLTTALITTNFGSAKMFIILFDVISSLISRMLFDLVAASSLDACKKTPIYSFSPHKFNLRIRRNENFVFLFH